jgi:hypothetical protein
VPTLAGVRPPPRLFGIPARDAPVVAVLRRGPSAWAQVGRWDVGSTPSYQPGSWLRGTLYPQRCDLSPDGRYLSYFTLRPHADWAPGPTYLAVSRLPWLTALVAWGTGGTWTRGLQFVAPGTGLDLDPPDVGSLGPLATTYGLAYSAAASFAVERRSGWTETTDTPPRGEHDSYDERRAESIVMQRASPRDGSVLTVRGGQAAFRGLPGWFEPPLYALDDEVLVDAQWADWTVDGRLLVATTAGELQVRDGAEVVWREDLAGLEPDPQPPPAEAARW